MYRDFQSGQGQKVPIQKSLERPRYLPKFNHNSIDNIQDNDRLKKIASEEIQLEKKMINISVEKIPSLPINQSRFLSSEDQYQFPNLKILTHILPSNLQRQSIELIIKNKPILAKSLDLYASGAQKIRQKRSSKIQKLKPRHLMSIESDSQPFQQVIDSEAIQKEMEKLPRIKVKGPDRKLSAQRFTNISNLFGNQEYNPTAMRSNLLNPNAKINRNILNEILFPNKTMPKFNYYIGPGNNGELIRRIMADRHKNWEEVSSAAMIIHFKWQQNQHGYNYEKLNGEGYYLRETLNQFEFHKEITSKIGLVRSLQKHFQNNAIQSFQMLPLAFVLNFEERGWETDLQSFTQFYNTNIPQKLQNQHTQQSVVLEFHNKKPYMSPYKFSTPTLNEHDRTRITSDFKLQNVLTNEESYLWLLKPADWNRGDGVHVFKNLSQLEDLLVKYYNGWYLNESEKVQSLDDCKTDEVKNNDEIHKRKREKIWSQLSKENKKLTTLNRGQFQKCRQFVIQKYIEKPFLIAGRKFDIRCWVLLSQTMNIYLFQEGYIRTSSEVFDLKNENPFIHLTNNAVQKFSKNYGNFESGNQMSYDELQNYLNTIDSPFNFRENALPLIKQYIQITLQSVRKTINKNNRKCCFQIFGYDFMLDSQFQPWLIEVNTNPCIEESSPLLQMLLPRMIDDAFKITLDVIYGYVNGISVNPQDCQIDKEENFIDFSQTKSEINCNNPNKIYQRCIKKQSQGIYPVHNYQDQKNMWEYLGSF